MHRSTLDALKDAIRSERIRRRISQADAAAIVGRSRKWLCDVERGAIDPTAKPLFELALALGIEIRIETPEVEL